MYKEIKILQKKRVAQLEATRFSNETHYSVLFFITLEGRKIKHQGET